MSLGSRVVRAEAKAGEQLNVNLYESAPGERSIRVPILAEHAFERLRGRSERSPRIAQNLLLYALRILRTDSVADHLGEVGLE